MRLEENKVLAPYTTLGVGGPARWFAQATTEEEIAESAEWARKEGVELFVLGGGSNLLVSDSGFDGLVLHVALKGIQVRGAESSDERIYKVAAGEDWDQFVDRAVADNCAGIECLAGIPGTVGGTPVQNVGAYGQEVASVIDSVWVFDLAERAFLEFSAAECGFAYRRSRFNTSDRGRFVVTRVDYRLKSGGEPEIKYADLQRELNATYAGDERPRLKDVAAAVRRVRQSKGMLLVEGDPDCRSAGSFFKNPIVSAEQLVSVSGVGGSEPPQFPAGPDNDDRVKLPAAWLIEKAGFSKGIAMGRAGISQKHTLALINRGGATAVEIVALAEKIKETVAERFGIQLEMEPVMLGFNSATL